MGSQRLRRIYYSESSASTRKIAADLVGSLPKPRAIDDGATVIACVGDLGAGKTTFIQGVGRALGIEQNIASPTFILMKAFRCSSEGRFRHLVHIDCWRMRGARELQELGFRALIQDKDAIVAVEWAEKIRSLLPPNTIWVRLEALSLKRRSITVEIPPQFLGKRSMRAARKG